MDKYLISSAVIFQKMGEHIMKLAHTLMHDNYVQYICLYIRMYIYKLQFKYILAQVCRYNYEYA